MEKAVKFVLEYKISIAMCAPQNSPFQRYHVNRTVHEKNVEIAFVSF